MKIWIRSRLNASVSVAEVMGNQVRIGNDNKNDIVLDSPLVAADALVLSRTAEGAWLANSVGTSRCSINDQLIPNGKRLRLKNKSRIELYPFQLQVEWSEDKSETEFSVTAGMEEMSKLIHAIHIHLLSLMDVNANDDERRNNHAYLLSMEHNIEEIADINGLGCQKKEMVSFVAGSSIHQAVCHCLIGNQESTPLLDHEAEAWCEMISLVPDLENVRNNLVQSVIQRLQLDAQSDLGARLAIVAKDFWKVWLSLLPSLQFDLQIYLAKREIKKQLKDIVFGYGPLEDLLRMPDVSEIMVVDSQKIFIERRGVLENSGRRFISDDVTLSIIERIVAKVGRRIDKSQPLVDARLMDGSRVNAVIPPLAISGPCLTIRKFPAERLTIQQLIEFGSITRTAAKFLRAAVISRKNIIISGGTGTGKTTLLNCLSEFIPDKERIVTVEDTAELQLSKQHVVRLETKPGNVENKGAYEIRDLVKNTLRMRPDRIVVGECRGGEALDMLQAMNTGHDGSLTTLHANNPRDAMLRLEVLVKTGIELPLDSIRRQIASAIDIVVQIKRDRDGRRSVSHISEVCGLQPTTSHVQLKHLFQHEDQEGPDGQGGRKVLMPSGYLPTFMEDLTKANLIDLKSFYS